MNQHDQMREALRSFIEAMDLCGDYPDTSTDRERLDEAKRKAEQILAHVNETPKNEHDSDDVLNKSWNVDMMREALRRAHKVLKMWVPVSWDRKVMEEYHQAVAAIELALAAEPAPLARLTLGQKLEAIELAQREVLPETINRHHALKVAQNVMDAIERLNS